MDRYVMESRIQELTHRSERLKRYVAQKAEGSSGEMETLLLETVDLTAELTELTKELVEEQLKMSDRYDNNYYGDGDGDPEEMFMMCPYCHESVTVSMNAMDQQATTCPSCHARLQLYSPS